MREYIEVDITKVSIKPRHRKLDDEWYFDEEWNLCKRKEIYIKDFLKEDEFRM